MTLKPLPTIRKISDNLWDEIKLLLPSQRANNTIGRQPPFRKVLNGVVYVLKHWLSMEEYSSGSTCHRRFQEWTASKVFQRLWIRLMKHYDDLKGIR